jgi:transcriptional regulator with XRE-family HTH domain
MGIPELLKAARAAKGWGQRRLAQEMRVSNAAVGQWENGTNLPTIENRVDLAKKLDIPFTSLLVELRGHRDLAGLDQEVSVLVETFLTLPPKVREAFLMQVVALAESLKRP